MTTAAAGGEDWRTRVRAASAGITRACQNYVSAEVLCDAVNSWTRGMDRRQLLLLVAELGAILAFQYGSDPMAEDAELVAEDLASWLRGL